MAEGEGKFKRKEQKFITLNVNIDERLTIRSCVKILEDILKYILYQRHQIPLQYEVLLKEVQQFDQLQKCESDNKKQGSFTNAVDDNYCMKVHRSKEDILARKTRKWEMNKKQWIGKIKTFIEDFKKVTQMLHSELETGLITAVSFMLGNSVSCCQEIYTFNLPFELSTMETTTLIERRVAMQFFRALVTNDDILRYVSQPCSIKKLWVMFEKQGMNDTSYGNWFSRTNNQSLTIPEMAHCNIRPYPNFQPKCRNHIVQINVHVPPLGTPMDLTPGVGKGLIDHMCSSLRKFSTKRPLVLNMPNATKRFSCEGNNRKTLECACSSPLEKDPVGINEYALHETKESSVKCQYCNTCTSNSSISSRTVEYLPLNNSQTPCGNKYVFSPCMPSLNSDIYSEKHSESLIETPTVSSVLNGRSKSVISSPSRILVSKIDKFKLADTESDNIDTSDFTDCTFNTEGRMWYCIDQCIKGFKSGRYKLS